MSFFANRRGLLFGLLAVPAAIKAAKTVAAEPPTKLTDSPLCTQDFTAFANKTPAQRQQELADREEIRELIARYAQRITAGLAIAPLFTEDAIFRIRMPGNPLREIRGRASLNQVHSATANRTMPMIHNHLLEISGNEARGTCFNELRSVDEAGKTRITTGSYDDRFRRENGQWKFAVRDFTLSHQLPG